mmetsp:Transcript_14545/g.24124  ORF Transcript_14545/g.24124 Transcript_14545/m.24124 type:complete len:230 (-) Transcript_14545:175-864(-)
MSTDNRLGSSDPLVAWSDNNITTRNISTDTIRHGSNGLSTTHANKFVSPGNVSCREGNGGGARTGKHDRFASRSTSSDSSHDNRRGEGVSTTRSVTSSGVAWTHSVSSLASRNINLHVDHSLSLSLGKYLDSIVNVDQRIAFHIGQTVKGSLAGLGRDNNGALLEVSQTHANLQQLIGIDLGGPVGADFCDNSLGLFECHGIDGVLDFERDVLWGYPRKDVVSISRHDV